MTDLARRIYRHAAHAWPAEEALEAGGWLLRHNRGVTRRGNSALPIDGDGPPEARIAAAEAFYRRRRLPAVVQIVPGARPHGLDRMLAARGYRKEGPTHVLLADPATVPAAGGHDVRGAARPDAAWLAVAFGHEDDASAAARASTVRRIGPPARFATAEVDRVPAGVGYAVVGDGLAGVFAMNVLEAHRRRGVGRAVLADLAGWAARRDCRRLYLFVEADNAPALGLYRKAGLVRDHGYHYRVADPSSRRPPGVSLTANGEGASGETGS